ncbi:FxsA family protein [Endozoicomonas sp. SM1973]|uniref:FxsA family protein n=1 Tax=Spartinivicinus marinus TaxID=2994442 RepID=A0A853IA14_9GAMM|nr:FxsA family protein [Spartinivicinus marinus]MCX4028369.1 FxsA family protein [Spartinivicinus marinus]NYZ68632.1 FxsA family protein [Spartinivicinus marinus]
MRPLLMLFIVVPIVEMFVLIKVGEVIGAWLTIGLVLLTAVIGLQLLRQQGLSTLMHAQQKMQQGQIPAKEMAEGIILAVGGALLLTPGFVTDALGFCCLLPFTRHWLIKQAIKKGFKVHNMHTSAHFTAEASSHRDPHIIDGEFKREDDWHKLNK